MVANTLKKSIKYKIYKQINFRPENRRIYIIWRMFVYYFINLDILYVSGVVLIYIYVLCEAWNKYYNIVCSISPPKINIIFWNLKYIYNLVSNFIFQNKYYCRSGRWVDISRYYIYISKLVETTIYIYICTNNVKINILKILKIEIYINCCK